MPSVRWDIVRVVLAVLADLVALFMALCYFGVIRL